ncbi:MAG: two-component regulator propeller domain-containing protein, partial [Bacteroidota bacterium]
MWATLCLLILSPSVHAQQYELRTYSVREGLAQSQAFSLLEDQRGYLWIGTRGGGLSRFDGEEFQTYTTRQGLVNNYLQALHEDPQGHLWIGTDQGACKYDGLRFEALELKTAIPAMVRAFASDQDRLWLGTDQGLFVYQDSQLNAVSLPGPHPDIFTLLLDEDTLWVGHAKGLYQLSPTDTLTWNLRAGTITDLERDAQGQLWIASYGRGLYRKIGQKFRRSFPDVIEGRGLIFDLMPDEEGHLWLATQDQGAIRLNLADSSVIRLNEANGLPSNHIHALCRDRSGNLWLGSSGGGLSKYFGQQFVHQGEGEGLPDRAVYAVLEDLDCQIWIGAGTQGLARKTSSGWIL